MNAPTDTNCERSASVTIAIPTYRRVASLESLLVALEHQRLPLNTATRVAIFDNDPQGSASSIVARRRTMSTLDLQYIHVPKPGLAEVRNAALTLALRSSDFLAMIDDDELPEPQWLYELLRVCETSGADAVVGPVPRRLPDNAPGWLREGGFLNDVATHADGEPLREGHSGNCLLRVASLRRMNLCFDVSMNQAGGEDVLFFRELVLSGGTIVFAAHARATELVDVSRLSVRYVMLRNLRTGNTLALCDKKLERRFTTLCLRFVKGLGRLALGMFLLLPNTLFHGFRGAMEALCGSLRGCGMLLGLAGIRVLEYRKR